jgi:small subunit ribosomal protein S4e
VSKHIKRLDQPGRWNIPKKDYTWAPKVRPGPHAQDDAVPLVVAVRDLLEAADTAAEARQAVKDGRIHVDGEAVRDERRGLGFMDAVTIPGAARAYRVLYDPKGRLALLEIDEADAEYKLARIEDKTTLPGGRTQLNLHDGRNVTVKEDDYATGDTIRITVPGQEIAEHFPFHEGAPAYVTGGNHVGEIGTIEERKVVRSSSPNMVELTDEETFRTTEEFAFVVGEDEPEIDIPGVELRG